MKEDVVEELRPLFNLDIDKKWKIAREKDSDRIVWFLFNGEGEYRTGIDYYPQGEVFSVWIHTVAFGQYLSLDKAIEKLKEYMEKVKQEYYFDQIANMRSPSRHYRHKLIDLSNIGKKTITRLVNKFTYAEKVKNATMEKLEKVKGIGKQTAWKIAGFLHENVRYQKLWDPEEERWISLYQIPEKVKKKHIRMQKKITREEKKQYKLSKNEIKERNLSMKQNL